MSRKYNIKIPSFHKQGQNIYAIIADDKVVAFEKHWRQGNSLNIVKYKTRRMVIKISRMQTITEKQYRSLAKAMIENHVGDIISNRKILR